VQVIVATLFCSGVMGAVEIPVTRGPNENALERAGPSRSASATIAYTTALVLMRALECKGRTSEMTLVDGRLRLTIGETARNSGS
jgi:hypothetical protein